MKKILFACSLLAVLHTNAQTTPLFNGTDLQGWHPFLATKGASNDPDKVFNVENGILHISGKEFGYIITDKSYKNFHLTAEFKWGKKKWPPRDADTTKMDNGILFYIPATAKDTVWPRGIECQIQVGDVGDIWLIDSTTVVVDGKRTEPKDYLKVVKKTDGEHKPGKWNRVEVIAENGNITYKVNGITVNQATQPSVTEGRILVQSEGAEIYYRKIEIEEL